MSTEVLIQTLIDLDLDPTAVDALSRQIREEGMTEDTRSRLTTLLREASATSRKTDEDLLDLFEIVATAQSKQERRKAELKLKLQRIEDDTEVAVSRIIASADHLSGVDQAETQPAATEPVPVWD